MNKNKKPELYTKQYYDYHECEKYIKYKYKINGDDFWSWVCYNTELSNGGFITINSDTVEDVDAVEDGEALDFMNKMIDEFGEDAEYLTSW